MLNLEQLNEMQRKAVDDPEMGPVLVLAGPGSGKTFTITQRIFYLIQVLHIPPQKILVLTFTKDAAASMKQRFLADCDSQISSPYFSTFHSLFYQILKESKHLSQNHLLKITEKKKLLKNVAEEYFSCFSQKQSLNMADTGLFDLNVGKRNSTVLNYNTPQFYQELADAFSILKNTNNWTLAQNKLSEEYRVHFQDIFLKYERKRRECNKLDFDDCLWECKELLSKDAYLKQKWQKRFDYILIDEFQDINPIQYDVIKLLSKSPYALFAVGDDDQAIYGFRGSSPKCLKQFQTEFQAKTITLNMNYRSTKEIVETANRIIAENKFRFQKDLHSFSSGNDIRHSVHIMSFSSSEEQNQYIINKLKDNKLQEKYAVLFRTNSQMQKFSSFLKIHNIPYEVREKIKSIYEHSVVIEVMSFLKVVQNTGNKEDMIRVVHMLVPSVPGEALTYITQKISDIINYYNRELSFGDVSNKAWLQEQRNLINEKIIRINMLKNKPFFLCIAMLRKQLGYETYLKRQWKEAEEYKEAISILEWMQEQSANYQDISEWEKNQAEYGQSKEFNQKEKKNINRVILMTIHGSKGLEFDKVWIPDCNERVYPYGLLQDEQNLEEERRIFYVGVTRAKKYLELTYLTGTKDSPRHVSEFLKPIL